MLISSVRFFACLALSTTALITACGDESTGGGGAPDDAGVIDDADPSEDTEDPIDDTEDPSEDAPDPEEEAQPPDPNLDTDEDGLTDLIEMALGTDPERVDSDNDGLNDPDEVGGAPEDPIDTDGDGLIDALEHARADNDSDGITDQGDPAVDWQITHGIFTPLAILNDGVDSARFEARIVGAEGVTRVTLARSDSPESPFGFSPLDGLQVDGQALSAAGVELFDDGTHGDRRAGDGVYTRDGFTTTARPGFSNRTVGSHALDQIAVTDAEGLRTRHVWDGYMGGAPVFASGPYILGIVAAAQVREVTDMGQGVQTTGNLINMVRPSEVGEITRFLGGENLLMTGATGAFYEVFGDDYDFLYIFPDTPAHGVAVGRLQSVQNSDEGLGQGQFDSTGAFGSSGRLQAVMALDMGDNGPTLHETLHRWGVFLAPEFGFQGAHWGFAGANGQLGGFDPDTLVDNMDGTWSVEAFGTFANGGDGHPYSPIELYLMGVLPAEEVDPIPVFDNPQIVARGGGRTTIQATGLRSVTIDDIVAAHGPRSPAVGEAPSNFKGAFVAFSNLPLTPAEMTFFDARGALFGASEGDGFLLSFEEATGGRATMETQVP